ncbi:hypothetical protein [Kitasatospora purpeofusca]|uniref:hypothetical protein n=1 Tax=Kitasatospora purpeofusca TaxID=67352 RepID=UPI002A59C589|nr:hypothetical protein [Kitasatospora purpeofusca]MDY0816008.1 hypothetical protein [Kitasatospora purpeofusca]
MTSYASHSADLPHGRPTLGATVAADPAEGRLPVGPTGLWGPAHPATGPWSVRSVRAGRSRGRAALEIYEHDELVDVLVATRLTAGLLRGARAWAGAGGRRRSRQGLAWGRLPHGGAVPVVGFTGGRLLRLPGRPAPVVRAAEVVTVGGEFWLAWGEGVFDGVLVEAGGAASERSPLVRARVGGAGGGAR